MKTNLQLQFAAAAVCAAALASCANPQPTPRKVPVSAQLRPDSSLNARIFAEVNAYRKSNGKGDLQRHSGLDRLAQQHSEYLRQHRGTFTLNGHNVSHIGFEGRALVARLQYHMENVSENVAAGRNPGANQSAMIVNLWKGSKDHNKNMLDQWTYSGLGVVVDSDGMVFATQLFSTQSNSQMSMRERLTSF